ncbi:secreted protein [Favolaschia claudopus]|uniref:Secreted protein n=1 Tax=Favolaschia claudopus TaxID=2862362 RepID=A0AAW0EBY4_9AGAR
MATPNGVSLGWVDQEAPAGTPTGTSFGIPWARGEVDKTTPIRVSAAGKGVPVQTWPLAYWPDGSLKWTGHSLAADSGLSDTLQLAPGTPAEPTSPVSVSQTDVSITVTTGSFTAKFNTSGTTLIDSLSLSGSAKAQNGSLVLLLQNAPDEPELAGSKPSVVTMNGNVESVTVEQSGPVRAVLKVTGKYSGSDHADFLPFILRFYIAAGATALRMNHFFIYDGDQFKDFIKGLGFQFSTPLTDLVHDRHVRFVSAAGGGVWGEAVRVVSGLRRDATAAVLTPQFNGTLTPPLSAWPASVAGEIDQLALWNDYTLDQLSPSYFSISKRTTGGRTSSFLNNAGFGTRASGLGYVGGASGGGVVFALRDFWQGAPRGLDIRGAAADTATVTLWAYSPRGPAIDMRHYDTVAHGLDLAYEDVGDPDPNPVGIGRSYEMTFQVVSATPSRETLAQSASVHTVVPQIVASPAFYASHKLFGGRWNVPDTSTTGAAAMEKRHGDLLDFYVAEVDQRQFYGFWDHGDVMHTYDQTRHTWRYDVGGFAWDNGEIGTDLWLWMSFLRTGRSDVWRLSYAMTRHLSEVDFHHTGPFAGLGSRHNVNHWGDGAKEARVAGSTLKRPFYYLTADELIGDLMDFSLKAGETIMTWDPLRKVFPPPDPAGPGRLRIGPDWTTLAGNWFTKWERTNDPQWLEKIRIGMRDIGGFKFGLFTGNGAAVGWNAATSHMVDEGGEGAGSYNLMMPFGGGEFLMEVMDLLQDDEPEFDAAWLDFCKLANAPQSAILARYGESFSTGVFTQWYAKLQAYAGERLNDTSLKQAAWDIINANKTGVFGPQVKVSGTDVINPINEIPNVTTNDCAGLSLSEYAVLAIAPELAPNSVQAVAESEWERSTLATQEHYDPKAGVPGEKKERKNLVRRILCL